MTNQPSDYPPPDQIDEIAKFMDEIDQQLAQPDLFRDGRLAAIRTINDLYEQINDLLTQWRKEVLVKAVKGVGDPDDYVRPVLTLAELLRKHKMDTVSRFVFEYIDAAVSVENPELHRGAVYANWAIFYLENGQYPKGLSYLNAAGAEDASLGRPASYALIDTGIFGQWVKNVVFRAIPAQALADAASIAGVAGIGEAEFLVFVRWLAERGDVQLFSGILEFHAVMGQSDVHSQATRFSCLRDLAGLFEVMIKDIGLNHTDGSVRAAFSGSMPPMLAAALTYMHYTPWPHRANKKNPMATSPDLPGPFWNAMYTDPDLVQAIHSHTGICNQDTGAFLSDLAAAGNLSANPRHDLMVRKILVAYHLRNLTSHSFKPQQPSLVANYNQLWTDQLAGLLGIFHWAVATGQLVP